MSIKNRTLERGLPDWSNVRKATNVSAMNDLGELAVRLGSPARYDRRGDVIFMDSFEFGFGRYDTFDHPPDSVLTLSTVHPRTGGYHAAIAFIVNPQWSGSLRVAVSLPETTRIGYEFSLLLSVEVGIVSSSIIAYDGLMGGTYNVYWDVATGQLFLLNALSNYVQFGTVSNVYPGVPYYHTGKLVVDMDTGRYVRFRLDDASWDLSAIPGNSYAAAAAPEVLAALTLSGSVAAALTVYVDDIIVTYNEP